MLRPCGVWHAAGEKAQKKLLVKAQPKPLTQAGFGAFALAQQPPECHALASNALPIAMAMPMASGAWPRMGEARVASVAREPVLACALRM